MAATTAMTRAPMKAIRMPVTRPQMSMQAPPTSGPRAIGKRRTRECMVTPMVRLFWGSTWATSPIVAGSEMAVQLKKKTDPTMTACQAGIRMTTTNPTMAIRLKISSARLVPSRSARYPPGKE